ncbi:MAG: universal stress protein [Acidimicrobiales bacterium]|nr:universal stress protein [Acidimicrobiales bacterium]
MFKTVVVGTDGSSDAESAVRVAAAIAKNHDAKLHVVTGARPMTPEQLYELKRSLPNEFWPQLHADYLSEERLSTAVGICNSAGIDATTHSVAAAGADAVLDTADEVGADLIVVGSRGEGAAKRLIHGSVSTKVLHHAPCSVLVIRD